MWASEPELALRTFYRKTAEYALVALGASLVGTNERSAVLVGRVVVWSGVLMALDGGAQWILGHDLLRGRAAWGHRLSGPFNNPNNFSAYLTLVISLQLAVATEERHRWKQGVLLLAVLLEVLELLQTDSRSSVLALAGSLAVLVVTLRKHVLVALLLLGGMGWWGLHRMQTLRALVDLSPGRLEGWTIAWRMFLDHPIKGIGLGTFMYNYMTYLPGTTGDWPKPQYAHNCYLQVLAEGGLLGLMAFTALVAAPLLRAGKALRRGSGTQKPWLCGFVAGVVVFLINIAFDTGLYSLPIALMFWIMLGLVAGMSDRPAPQRQGVR